MHFWLIFLAGLLFGAAPARAAPPGTATVTVQMKPDGAHATVVLDRAVTRFAFAQADVVREGDLELLTPGLTLKGDAVTAERPFRRFDLRILPMKEERDAKYPAHYRIGEGGVVYAPALKGDEKAWRTRFRFKLAAGQVRAPASGDIGKGFIFIGPAALRSDYKGITVIADPKTPAWLVERTRTDLAAAVEAYTLALGAPLPRKPLLIVKHEPGERNFNIGDVTPGAITTLRFHGDAWAKADAQAGKHIQGFVLHEAFHFWNGGLASHANGTPTWLHEGGAEYASLLGGLKSGVLAEEDVRRRLSEALQRCRAGLQNQGDKGLGEIAFLSGQLRYPCGMVLQWAADLHMRRASGGKRTVMDAWADVIRVARARPSGSYTLQDFYSAAGIDPAAFQPIRLLVGQGGAERWTALPGALNALGAEVGQSPSPDSRRGALLFHLLRQNCRNLPQGASFGFYVDARAVKLDSPAGCGGLAGNPVVQTVEGGDVLAMTDETYEAVQRKCAAGQSVSLAGPDDRTLSAACAAPLGPPPQDYVVTRWQQPAT